MSFAQENLHFLFYLAIVALFIRKLYLSNGENHGANYSIKCVYMWNQEIPLEFVKKLKLNQKPQKSRKEYFLLTYFLPPNLIDIIYANQKHDDTFQSKFEITPDFILVRQIFLTWLNNNVNTLISIPCSKYVWIVLLFVIRVFDSYVTVNISALKFLYLKNSNILGHRICAVLVLYTIQQVVFFLVKKCVQFLLDSNEKIEKGTIKFTFFSRINESTYRRSQEFI